MKMSDRYSASEDVVARIVSGETVLLDLKSGEYFGLDAVGGHIWALMDGNTHSLAEICDLIEAEFDAPRDLIERDMLSLIKDLSERELIVRQPD